MTPTRCAVIIPAFNEGPVLSEAVGSLAANEPVELVVVDDGSTDEKALRVLEDLERDGVRVLRQGNQGQAAALMAGVSATAAPYLYRLDADDLVEPGAIAALADALDADGHAAAAWGDLTTFGLTSMRVPAAPTLDPWHITYVSLLPSCSMFRRTALLDAGGWTFRGPFDDWDLWMALAERGYSGSYVPRVAYRYRRERTGVLSSSLERFGDHYERLRRRHGRLFSERPLNRRRSQAPLALKTVLPAIDRLPLLPRLQKVWLAQLCTHLFWNGGPRATLQIVLQGIAVRLHR